jgi:uncharacterized protein YpmB
MIPDETITKTCGHNISPLNTQHTNMGKFRGANAKAAAASDKKSGAQQVKDAKDAAEREKEVEKDWSKGANLKGQRKSETEANKADEAARKRQEKAALLAEEEEANLTVKTKKTPTLPKKGKKKKNDISLLEDALVGAADKKVKSKRASERLKEEKRAEQARKKEPEKPLDPLLANTQNMIAGTEDDLVGRAANKALDGEGAAAGIDGALDVLNIGKSPAGEPSKKALFKAFEERKMSELKEELPGLKMSQYKDKVFNLWKKSPENPANQQRS